MSRLLIVVCVLVLLGYVRSESCSSPGDCVITKCDSVSTIACTTGVCECVLNGIECTSRQECLDKQNWFCPDLLRHCTDNKCVCQFYPTR